MARRFDPDDEDDLDAPLPSDQALGDLDDDDLDPMPCPYCGARMSERQEVCPKCHSFVLREDVPKRRPAWVLVTMIVLILSLIIGIVSLR